MRAVVTRPARDDVEDKVCGIAGELRFDGMPTRRRWGGMVAAQAPAGPTGRGWKMRRAGFNIVG